MKKFILLQLLCVMLLNQISFGEEVILIAPANGSTRTSSQITLEWSGYTTITTYWVQVATDINFTALFYDNNVGDVNQKTIDGFSDGTTYYWRVQGFLFGGVPLGWTDPWSFNVEITLPIPLLLSPPDGAIITTNTLNLKWSSVAGATAYWVQVSENNNFTSLIYNENIGYDTTIIISGLENGITYFWRARAAIGITWLDYSIPWNFITPELGFDEQIISPSPLADVTKSSIAWGDYDNDNDLDLLLTGDAGAEKIAKIYRNDGSNTFIEQTSIVLPGVDLGSAAWGDYDNDNDLDLLLTGDAGAEKIAKIFKNEGSNIFNEQFSISLIPVAYSSVAWGDYDNDGYLDILLTGYAEVGIETSKIYRNNGDNTFTEQTTISLTGVGEGFVAWGDYDNDGDLDILLTGNKSGDGDISIIYKNEGNNSFSEQSTILLLGVSYGSGGWGDYDNDGYLDILLTGFSSDGTPSSKIYRNNGDGSFTDQLIPLIGIGWGSSAWGDYDNDGDLDIILSGSSVNGSISKIYRNDGSNAFTEQTSIVLMQQWLGTVAWADYDNDNDLDLLLTGVQDTKLYNNNNMIINLPPTPPTGLFSEVGDSLVILHWNKSTDNQTPQDGLRYNIVIGTTPGAVNTLSPMSDRNTGYRRVINLGNTNHNNSWAIRGLERGTYYWSVQAVDNSFAGSTFSAEKSFKYPPPFTEQTISPVALTELDGSSVAWGDYDNDQDLDLLLTGHNGSAPISKIYRNDGTNIFLEQTSISLIGVSYGSSAWGDYDNDGDLDILLTGTIGSSPISKIYRNDADTIFTPQNTIVIIGVFNSSVSFGDYDNDGDLDILVAGEKFSGDAYSGIYRNNNDGSFTEMTSINLVGVKNSSVAWGDYDNDGYLDILLTGDAGAEKIAKIFKNEGSNIFNEQSSISLIPVAYSSVAWGDYNSDSYLDILLTGYSDSGQVSKIYLNNQDGTFTEQSISITGVGYSSAAWGDYDNDGDLDILLTGLSSSNQPPEAKIYQNDDGSFTDQNESISLTGVWRSSVAWADYDNDGDLDILLSGNTVIGGADYTTKIYRNKSVTANNIPTAPTNLSSLVNGLKITLSWNKSTDNETPQDGLKYNLVIGTNPGEVNTLSPMSDRATGYRRVINLGNVNQNNSWTIKRVPEGRYYWSVQAIDNCYAGSIFAIEDSFDVIEPFTEQSISPVSLIELDGSSVAWGDYDNDQDLDILLTGYTGSSPISKIYRNDGGNIFLEQTSISLIGVSYGSSAWGDYDNDGDLDIIITGAISNGSGSSKLYSNNGDGTFTTMNTYFVGVYNSSVAWGDYDNDGYLDLLITGDRYIDNRYSAIYRNNRDNTFTESVILPIGVEDGSVAWGDYDNDGDLDILLTGYSSAGPISMIYCNNGNNTFTEQTSINITGVYLSSVAWGDYNSDSYLDILLTGYSDSGQVSKIYLNNQDGTFAEQSISITGVGYSSATWGDYDNDGDLDILLTGLSSSNQPPEAKIYQNDDGSFTDQYESISLTGVWRSSVAWADYDNDGDLDILLTGNASIPIGGTDYTTKIYKNKNVTANSIPTAPTNLLATINGEEVTLSWNKSTDNQTPQDGLKYNLVIGTTPGAVNTLSPMSDRNTGYRRVINLGNVNHNNSWTIKGLEPGTYYWGVQALDNNFAGSVFSSEEAFAKTVSSTNWINQVNFQDAGGKESVTNLVFGQKPEATNGIDTTLGEYELPAVPGLGTFDARFILHTIPEVGSLIDIRDSSETEVNWKLKFQPGPVGYPMIFSWDALSFPTGTFYLTDVINGTIININMRNQGSYTITDPAITSLYIKYQRLVTTQLSVALTDGWNMVSVPGLHPTNQNVTTWWSGKDPAAGVFRFSGGYLPVTTTTPGQGYWMKHVGANTYNTGGEWPAGGIQIVTHDPIAAATGWNLIGGYETNVATSGITTTPAGLQTGSVFQYGTGYTVATNLVPGYGYWIKLTGDGSINIPTSLAKGLAKPTEINTSDWGKLIITDKSGKSYTLYSVKGEVNLNDYELPPAPPVGMFDVRFGSGRYAEQLGAALQTIELNSLEYPVKVRVENTNIRLQDGTGNGLNERLKSGEEVTISNSDINKLMVSGEIVPDKYTLEQNYPNPFNPSTKIEFSIPEDVNNVALTIFNALGQRVAELVNSKLEAGKYSYVWNASDVATGLYIYELRTDKFVSIKKMILIK